MDIQRGSSPGTVGGDRLGTRIACSHGQFLIRLTSTWLHGSSCGTGGKYIADLLWTAHRVRKGSSSAALRTMAGPKKEGVVVGHPCGTLIGAHYAALGLAAGHTHHATRLLLAVYILQGIVLVLCNGQSSRGRSQFSSFISCS